MRFELISDPTLPPLLSEELDLTSYLEMFAKPFALLPHKALPALTEKEGRHHFLQLESLSILQKEGKLDIGVLLGHYQKLPYLDTLLPFFSQKNMEPYHLFLLGKFLSQLPFIYPLEEIFPLKSEMAVQQKEMLSCLLKYMDKGFRSLLLNEKEESLQSAIRESEEQLQQELVEIEKQIESQVGLKMVYPYSKELPLESPHIAPIQDCALLSIKREDQFWRVDFQLPSKIEKLVVQKEEQMGTLRQLIQEKLSQINQELAPYFHLFKESYHKRQERLFHYLLVKAMEEHNLVIPQFIEREFSFKGKSLRLPKLAEDRGKHYIPLHIDLSKGSNVVFGANMSGKTTILKTLFFHLWAIQRGLPVPAESITLRYPEKIKVHLKSSGNLNSHLSSFGEEVAFFTPDIESYSYILVDELFQSTNPLSGAALSHIFLHHFSQTNLVFFCTSQYPEVLRLESINLLRMVEGPDDPSKELWEQNRYEVEHISPDQIESALKESFRPLKVALHFPLPTPLKEKIEERLKQG